MYLARSYSYMVARIGVSETEKVFNTNRHRQPDLSYSCFRQLPETFLFGQWHQNTA